jgi:hypothetical protein
LNKVEFGIWMTENMELGLQINAELEAAGLLRPVETGNDDVDRENTMYNAAALILEMKKRYPERFRDLKVE